jgi:hypothetical protein
MPQKTQNFKRAYDQMAHQARQQMALIQKCRMRKTGGKGTADQPFYTKFLNR